MHILHFVSESADCSPLIDRRRVATAREITRCAQLLTEERGLDGFTMEELAEEVGCSRRTLFNYVPGKVDAVIGPQEMHEPPAITEFRQGGPTGDLVADMRAIGAAVLREKGDDVEQITRFRRLLKGDPRLVKAVHDRLEVIAGQLADAIIEREGGEFDPYVARVLARVSMCIFDVAVEEFLADSSLPPEQHYFRAFDTTTELFNPNT